MSKYYLFGIKGAGMSALAQLLYDHNHEVRGCDFEKSIIQPKAFTRGTFKWIPLKMRKFPKITWSL